MNFKKNRNTLIILLLILVSSKLQSQTSVLNGKVNFRLGSSIVNSKWDDKNADKTPMWHASVSYNFNRHIEAGLYIGYGSLMHKLDLPYNETTGWYEWYSVDSTSYILSDGPGGNMSSQSIRYGLNAEIHLMSFLNEKDTKIDLYVQPQLGFQIEKYDVLEDYQQNIWSAPFWEYGIGVGIRYRLTRHIGVFSDYSFGKFYNKDRHKIKVGIAISL